jgi:hypothetical protein
MRIFELLLETTKVIKKTQDYTVRSVQRPRADDSIETRYEVLDSRGVTRKIFMDKQTALDWARDNWVDLE